MNCPFSEEVENMRRKIKLLTLQKEFYQEDHRKQKLMMDNWVNEHQHFLDAMGYGEHSLELSLQKLYKEKLGRGFELVHLDYKSI